MDIDEKEQRRGMTLKSFAIALRRLFTPKIQSSVDPHQMAIPKGIYKKKPLETCIHCFVGRHNKTLDTKPSRYARCASI